MSEQIKAAEQADWGQVVRNGGPPCFHIEDGRFCLRAERWGGHGSYHAFVSLAGLLEAAKLREAALKDAIDIESQERDAALSALKRVRHNFVLAVSGKPVRDMTETLAECDAALA